MGHRFTRPGITRGYKPDDVGPQQQPQEERKTIWERPFDWPEPETINQIEPTGPNTMKPNWFKRTKTRKGK